MSAKSDAIETAVTDYIQARTALDAAPDARARVLADRAFARLAALVRRASATSRAAMDWRASSPKRRWSTLSSG
jgi:hypothetical protein